jgi:hypothetical protein
VARVDQQHGEARINDDTTQFGGIGAIAADQNIYGRVYVSGSGRGVLYRN